MSPNARVVTNARTRGGTGHSGMTTSAVTAQALEQRRHVAGKRRLPLHRLARARVNERQLRSVQRLTCKGKGMARAAAVDRIPDQRVADVLEMHADLMTKSPSKYKVLPGLYSREEIAIGLPAGDFDWWRAMNAWVEQFNASGENSRLFKQWFGYDLPPIQAQY